MTPITYVKGDATKPHGDGIKFICHICNDEGKWCRGFVLALSKRWPYPEKEYRKWYRAGFELGQVQMVLCDPTIYVANMIAQHGVGQTNGPPIRYDALRECLTKIGKSAKIQEASIHMPRIGCGLSGGSWAEVEPIIASTICTLDIPVTVYDFG